MKRDSLECLQVSREKVMIVIYNCRLRLPCETKFLYIISRLFENSNMVTQNTKYRIIKWLNKALRHFIILKNYHKIETVIQFQQSIIWNICVHCFNRDFMKNSHLNRYWIKSIIKMCWECFNLCFKINWVLMVF